jgi:hypothetical protein
MDDFFVFVLVLAVVLSYKGLEARRWGMIGGAAVVTVGFGMVSLGAWSWLLLLAYLQVALALGVRWAVGRRGLVGLVAGGAAAWGLAVVGPLIVGGGGWVGLGAVLLQVGGLVLLVIGPRRGAGAPDPGAPARAA